MTTTTTLTLPSERRDPAPTVPCPITASPAAYESGPSSDKLPSGLEIRPYNPETDLEAIEPLFRSVYSPLYYTSGLTTIGFTIFCRAYLAISPETCLVLVGSANDASPRILGYIVATPSSSAFCDAFSAGEGGCKSDIDDVPAAPRVEEMRDPALRGRCMEYFHQRNAWVSAVSSAAGVQDLVFSGRRVELVEQFPAHFHMAVAPGVQGCGYGGRLVEELSLRLLQTGVRGVFAAVPAGNERARRLYARFGFSELQGEAGDEGEDGHGGKVAAGAMEMERKVYMVKSLE